MTVPNYGCALKPDTPDTRYVLQQLARQQMIQKLLTDIRFDMQVCELEGWDAKEFPTMVRQAVKEEWCHS